jgi:hypothetical protein
VLLYASWRKQQAESLRRITSACSRRRPGRITVTAGLLLQLSRNTMADSNAAGPAETDDSIQSTNDGPFLAARGTPLRWQSSHLRRSQPMAQAATRRRQRVARSGQAAGKTRVEAVISMGVRASCGTPFKKGRPSAKGILRQLAHRSLG